MPGAWEGVGCRVGDWPGLAGHLLLSVECKKPDHLSWRKSILRIWLIVPAWCSLRCYSITLISCKHAVRSRGSTGLGLLSLHGGDGSWETSYCITSSGVYCPVVLSFLMVDLCYQP